MHEHSNIQWFEHRHNIQLYLHVCELHAFKHIFSKSIAEASRLTLLQGSWLTKFCFISFQLFTHCQRPTDDHYFNSPWVRYVIMVRSLMGIKQCFLPLSLICDCWLQPWLSILFLTFDSPSCQVNKVHHRCPRHALSSFIRGLLDKRDGNNGMSSTIKEGNN